ncbi:MAG: biotin synthase BioB [Sandaracinaceae bacterium]|jgi:biotin synthase|nr:biotin synthase BioB [Sandaracinaceae bacterium]
MDIRHDWTVAQVREIYDLPLTELVFRAQTVHRQHHPENAVQLCTLLSVKTGGCPEDCAYCPQSARNDADVEPEKLLSVESVLSSARKARESGSTRFCMGAAWRDAKSGKQFDDVLTMVRGVRELGMEACATLGMLNDDQAKALADAGLTAYNHNIDTSREFYGSIITTRTFDERLQTLERVTNAGIGVCCGGIIGLGESITDRCRMIVTLARMTPHPSSVPVNALVPVSGTPLENQPRVDPLELVRMIAVARITMPKAMVRLSAGRSELSREAQMLCFMAGANSIFYGDKLLTTGNPDVEADQKLLADLGMKALVPHAHPHPTAAE